MSRRSSTLTAPRCPPSWLLAGGGGPHQCTISQPTGFVRHLTTATSCTPHSAVARRLVDASIGGVSRGNGFRLPALCGPCCDARAALQAAACLCLRSGAAASTLTLCLRTRSPRHTVVR
jgi:hypothetical protein